jgi:hypothetical protein
MALIGIEYLDRFADVRAAGQVTSGGQDLSCPYYIANWFGPILSDAGHVVKFLRSNHAVAERHMRDVTEGGDDAQNADSVDLFLIITHGKYQNRELSLLYDNQVDDWFGHSKRWHFGDSCNLEWLMIYGCHSIDADDILAHLGLFRRLHLFCGAHGDMFDSFTIDEAGADTANNLLAGHTVAESWGDGVSDWFVSNHPMVISVERMDTWGDGHPHWSDTVIGSDHLWGEGTVLEDIPPSEQFWMASQWWDGGIYG